MVVVEERKVVLGRVSTTAGRWSKRCCGTNKD